MYSYTANFLCYSGYTIAVTANQSAYLVEKRIEGNKQKVEDKLLKQKSLVAVGWKIAHR